MMIGNKAALDIYAGTQKIAQLSLIDDQLHWHYHPEWQEQGYPVSPYLPFDSEISTLNVQRFLRNLLPEGNALDELVASFHLSKYNTFGLVRALGMDTPGSLIMLPAGQALPDNASFRSIADEELEARLNNRDEFGLIIWDGKPRLSVAGVQDKINVVVNPEGQLGFGEGRLCSTHILKFERQKFAHLAFNEFLTMQLAKACGLQVAEVELLRFGVHSALLIKRFDRKFVSMSEIKRRHIIDGCQALNLPPDYKYERNFGSGRDVSHIRDGASLNKLMDFANQCLNPALVKQQIVDWVLFNVAVFNFDAHGKNISFYIGNKGIELAPFYDLVNIKMYPDFEHELAMGLGDEFDGNAINAWQLADFAEVCGLPRSLITNRLKYIINKLQTELSSIKIKHLHAAEIPYMEKYRAMVLRQCGHLLRQAEYIASIEL